MVKCRQITTQNDWFPKIFSPISARSQLAPGWWHCAAARTRWPRAWRPGCSGRSHGRPGLGRCLTGRGQTVVLCMYISVYLYIYIYICISYSYFYLQCKVFIFIFKNIFILIMFMYIYIYVHVNIHHWLFVIHIWDLGSMPDQLFSCGTPIIFVYGQRQHMLGKKGMVYSFTKFILFPCQSTQDLPSLGVMMYMCVYIYIHCISMYIYTVPKIDTQTYMCIYV